MKLGCSVLALSLAGAGGLPADAGTAAPEGRPVRSGFVGTPTGWAPGYGGLAISPDGKTAYVSFDADDSLLEVDLQTFTVRHGIDVSPAGTMLSSAAAVLTADGTRLVVANRTRPNVLVVDTATRLVQFVVDAPPRAQNASLSILGTKAYFPSQYGGNGLHILDLDSGQAELVQLAGYAFGPTLPSRRHPGWLYSVGGVETTPGSYAPAFLTYDTASRTIVASHAIDLPSTPVNLTRLVADADEDYAYFGYVTPGVDKGTGALTVFDLQSYQTVVSSPVENGIQDLAVDDARGTLYLVGFWSGGGAPNVMPVHEWDMSTNQVVRDIVVQPSSDCRAIAIDPVDPRYFYMTEADFNLLRKVDIVTGTEVGRVFFSRGVIKPYAIVPGDGSLGYVFCQGTGNVYELDLAVGQLTGALRLPNAPGAIGYRQGRIYASTSSRELTVLDPSDGAARGRFALETDINPVMLTFSGGRMALVDLVPGGMVGRRLLFFDADTMRLVKAIPVPAEPHGDQVIVSPDATRFYVERGLMMGGTATITVLDAATLATRNVIEVPAMDRVYGATGFFRGAFDTTARRAYLTGFRTVYRLDMDTDQIEIEDGRPYWRVTPWLWFQQEHRWGWPPTGLSGVVLTPSRDRVFTVAGDSHTAFNWAPTSDTWGGIVNVGGYFNTDAKTSPDGRSLFVVNARSDSISVVDLQTTTLNRIVELPSLLSIGTARVGEGDSGASTASFAVALSPAAATPVTVAWTTADGTAQDGTDYAAATGTLTFDPGETSKTIAVTVLGDTAVEPDETFSVALSAPSGAMLARGGGTATIVDDDHPRQVTIAAPTKIAAGAPFLPGGTVTYTITLENQGNATQLDNPGAEFVDALDPSFTSISASASSGTPAIHGNTVTWDGTIAPGGSVTITIACALPATAVPGSAVTNQGTVSFDADTDGVNESTAVTDDPALPGNADPTAITVASPPYGFYPLAPCRLLDTRDPTGPYGGPALQAGATRVFALSGRCTVPAEARAVSVNATATEGTAPGHLRLYPAGQARPNASTLNFVAGQTRANNAVVPLNGTTELAVYDNQAAGTVHFVLDVNGYFR
jgi:uncharacterized repeat protein (TIGR01451 family)